MKKAKAHLFKDPIFKKAMKALTPLDLPPAGEVFNELVKAIVYQQISYKAANSIYDRFIKEMGSENYVENDLIAKSESELRAVGFSKQKINYAFNIAVFFKEHKLSKLDWTKKTDEELLELLTTIKGVGEWTVQMLLIFQLKRMNVFPKKDLAIQQSICHIYNIKSEKKEMFKEMDQVANTWAPYRSLASLYLWSWKRANP